MTDEERLLRRMHDLVWMSPASMPTWEQVAVKALQAKGQAVLVEQGRGEVWRLTDAGKEAAEAL